MVATRVLTYGPPITASPARLKADPTKPPFILALLKDFPVNSISADADAITKKLHEMGFAFLVGVAGSGVRALLFFILYATMSVSELS